ncbi:hypothetical protein MGN70_002614 [Eutypa lata]|nr:hypothetical protein MGN70_002614 [Eutypa lata]
MSGSSGLRKSPSRHHKSGAESPRNTQVLQEPRAVEQTNDNPKTRPALLPVILITAPKSPSLPPTGPRKRRAPSPDSDLEAETGPPSKQRKMPSKKPSSSEKHSSKSKPKTDDWADVMEPEERRRIQNRIAQRKFREKAKEQKERAERETRDQEHAGSSYRIADPRELGDEDGDLSGLPWGGLNVRHAMVRGHHETEGHRSRHSGGGGNGSPEDYDHYGAQYQQQRQQQQQQQQQQYGGSAAGDSIAGSGGDVGGSDYYYHQQQYQHQQTPSYGSGDSGAGGGGGVDDGRYYDDQQASSYPYYYHPDPNAGDES